jgi:hypothetical protein
MASVDEFGAKFDRTRRLRRPFCVNPAAEALSRFEESNPTTAQTEFVRSGETRYPSTDYYNVLCHPPQQMCCLLGRHMQQMDPRGVENVACLVPFPAASANP